MPNQCVGRVAAEARRITDILELPAEKRFIEPLRPFRIMGQQIAPDDFSGQSFTGWRIGN